MRAAKLLATVIQSLKYKSIESLPPVSFFIFKKKKKTFSLASKRKSLNTGLFLRRRSGVVPQMLGGVARLNSVCKNWYLKKQISAAWFDPSWPKLAVEKPNVTDTRNSLWISRLQWAADIWSSPTSCVEFHDLTQWFLPSRHSSAVLGWISMHFSWAPWFIFM